MNAKEKFNAIIQSIENDVAQSIKGDESYSRKAIAKRAFEAGCAPFMTDRETRALFVFMINKTVADYIDERRMMQVYQYLIDTPNYNLNRAFDIAMVENHETFIRKFKKHFSLTPDKAAKKKDRSLLTQPITWDMLGEDVKEKSAKVLEGEKMKFGLPELQLIKVLNADNLQKFFGLNDVEAELAFNIAENYSLDIDETFEYVYNYIWMYIEKLDLNPVGRDISLKEDLLDKRILHMYFKNELSFNEMLDLLNALDYLKHVDPVKPITEMNRTECLDIIREYEELYGNDEELYGNDEENGGIEYYDDFDCNPDIEELNPFINEAGEYTDEDDYELRQEEYNQVDPEKEFEREEQYYEQYYWDLNDAEYYNDLCQKVEDTLAKHKGNPEKRMPEYMVYGFKCPDFRHMHDILHDTYWVEEYSEEAPVLETDPYKIFSVGDKVLLNHCNEYVIEEINPKNEINGDTTLIGPDGHKIRIVLENCFKLNSIKRINPKKLLGIKKVSTNNKGWDLCEPF